MKDKVADALANADSMYQEYARLSQLGELSLIPDEEQRAGEIVASVSPVLLNTYKNALLG